MRFNGKILVPISIVFLSGMMLLGFQNCSGVNFSEAPLAQGEISAPSMISPNTYSSSLSIPASPKADGNLNIALLLDDSKSNVPNISSMLTGIEDLVNNLSDKSFNLEVYTGHPMGSRRPQHQVITRSESERMDGLIKYITYTNVLNPNPLAKLKSGEEVGPFIDRIRNHLNGISQAASEFAGDTSPDPRCEILQYLHDKFSAEMGPEERYVILHVTDEDMAKSSGIGRPCYKGSEVKQTPIQTEVGRYAAVPVEFGSVPLEGGGYSEWETRSVRIYGELCSELTQEKIDQALGPLMSSPFYRIGPNTYQSSSCINGTYGGGTGHRSETISSSFYFGSNDDSNVQMTAMYQMIPKSNVFFGGFYTLKPEEIKNSDQEIASRLMSFAHNSFSSLGTKFYSISDTSYSDFVTDVLNFEHVTARNTIDISSLVSQFPSITVKAVKVKLSGQTSFREVAFKRVESRLVITDSSIDLSIGAEVVFSYEL